MLGTILGTGDMAENNAQHLLSCTDPREREERQMVDIIKCVTCAGQAGGTGRGQGPGLRRALYSL